MDQAKALDELLAHMVADYVGRNRAAGILKSMLDEAGVGLAPLLDHVTIRTLDIEQGAQPFVELGYVYDETLSYEDWYAKVYRKAGYPALFVDQAYTDERGKTSIIPAWVRKFGDKVFHHVAVRVEDIERAVDRLKSKGIVFAGTIVGNPGDRLRQIFSAPEMVDGQPFTVLELAERHRGYLGFLPPQADSLMKSTVARQ
jgi:catechol 2,3-dioxygenase-like lactoylglutathione lyase family enzyme